MEVRETNDGSLTLWNPTYRESYHSLEGAVVESYYKHIRPGWEGVLQLFREELERGERVWVLDICFGLGYNTFLTLLHLPPGVRVKIITPELDQQLLKQLPNFQYPPSLAQFKPLLLELLQNRRVEGEWGEIELFVGDARELLSQLPTDSIHLCYQDPFSPTKNPELWSWDYFQRLAEVLKKRGVITTYSVATSARCPLYKMGFQLYTHPYPFVRPGTIFSRAPLPFPQIDFAGKLTRTRCRYYRQTSEGFILVEE